MDDFDPKDGIILVDKPAGMSSFGVVAKIRGFMRKKYGRKIKVGHTGTLDPFATGLLIILCNKMTKQADSFLKKDKVYTATLRLGDVSTTGDPEGEITHRSNVIPDLDTINAAIRKFVGEISQRPPMFSAIKINGERAYKLARAGKDFEMPERKVTVYDIKVLDYKYPELKIQTFVSSGTYIRTLAEDIGKELGVGAYLTALRRQKIADYDVTMAHPLSDFAED